MTGKPEYQGYPLETLLRARPNPQMVVNNVVQVAVTTEWAARFDPATVGAWYPDGQHAQDDTAFINANYRHGWSLLKGCQAYVDQRGQAASGGLRVEAQDAESVMLAGDIQGTTFRIPRRCSDAFVAGDDVLLPVYSTDQEGSGGTYVIVVRNDVVMAAIHARTPSVEELNRALENATLPRVYRGGSV